MNDVDDILAVDITHLGTSKEFANMCNANGFKNLGEIVALPSSTLTRKPLFGMRMLKELIDILSRKGIENLLKE